MTLRRILVTGYSGYLGSWVLPELRLSFPDAELHGAARRAREVGLNDATECYLHARHEMDVTVPYQIDTIIDAVKPDLVVHLAGLRHGSLGELLAVNALGLEHLLSKLEKATPTARIVVVGSAAELGRSDGRPGPLKETAICEPVDAYGVAKLAQSAIAAIRARRGQSVVRLRVFNLIGPALPESLLPGRCARLLLDSTRPAHTTSLKFGPLSTRRDYVDVRDVARAVALAGARTTTETLFHVGSGHSHSGSDVVETLISISGRENVCYTSDDSSGNATVPQQIAEIGRANKELGWRPEIAWRQSLMDLWDSLSDPVDRS